MRPLGKAVIITRRNHTHTSHFKKAALFSCGDRKRNGERRSITAGRVSQSVVRMRFDAVPKRALVPGNGIFKTRSDGLQKLRRGVQ